MTDLLSGLVQMRPVPSGAVEVLPFDAPRDVWLAERRNSIGGSDMSVLAGMANDRYASRFLLWLDKTGRAAEQEITSPMEWGVLLEPVVREWFARTYDLDVRRAGMFRHPDHRFIHANPDGLIVDEAGTVVGGLEVKTSNWRQASDWADDQVPDHAELQAQVNMLVTGVDTWWVAGLIDGRDPQVRLVKRDDQLLELIAPLAEEFFLTHVIPDEAPALDGSTATSSAVRAWMAHVDPGKTVVLTDEMADLFDRLGVAKAVLGGVEQKVRELDSQLRVAIGDAELIVQDGPDGGDEPVILATYPINGTFSPKRFSAAEPSLAQEFTVDRPALDTAALKAAHPDHYRAHCARVLRPKKALTELLAARANSPHKEG